MDYETFDSSGTDDDLPPPHQNRIARVGRVQGNGRQVRGNVSYPRMYNDSDMEAQIHQLEQEAYSSVLRAFKAQADTISWEKESVITELRKELRLSNEEHRELLARVNADDVLKRIREWRQAGGVQSSMHGQPVHETLPSPTVSASRKKPKVASSVPSQSFGAPSPSFHPQTVSASHQPSSSAAKHGPIMGNKGKKQKPGQLGTSFAMKPLPYPSSGPSGRGQVASRAASGIALDGSLIGKRIRTRWPEDKNFYEAVITDYNPVDGCHQLVYDMGTPHETNEWINLVEISPEDIKWESEELGVPYRGGYGGRGMHRSIGHDGVSGVGRGRGVPKGQFRKDLLPSQNGMGRRLPEEIRILHTDSLIKEVERVFVSNRPDPVEIEKAKKVLNDHEQALIEAISRIADISDGEIDEGGHHYGQAMERQ